MKLCDNRFRSALPCRHYPDLLPRSGRRCRKCVKLFFAGSRAAKHYSKPMYTKLTGWATLAWYRIHEYQLIMCPSCLGKTENFALAYTSGLPQVPHLSREINFIPDLPAMLPGTCRWNGCPCIDGEKSLYKSRKIFSCAFWNQSSAVPMC